MIVLIVIIHLGLYGNVHSVAMHDFVSKQACEDAAIVIKDSDNKTTGTTVETHCVPK